MPKAKFADRIADPPGNHPLENKHGDSPRFFPIREAAAVAAAAADEAAAEEPELPVPAPEEEAAEARRMEARQPVRPPQAVRV
jgi:hypothetical protein